MTKSSPLARQEHRPWPIPTAPWTWRQSWLDLLFAHWPLPASVLRPLVPAALELQELDGSAWIGLVPFRMAGVMRRPLPDMPGISAFPELNVRTYVELDGKPGVWFLSLDAANRLAVWAARRFFHLPYHYAAMTLTRHGDEIRYVSARAGAELAVTYAPTSEPYFAAPGSLEHWLTERYCLYARAPDGSLWRNDVQHHPWPLQRARATFDRNTLFDFHGVSVEGPPVLCHFAERLDVVVWNGERLAG
jgi:uncharacterized protein YqjF (DUF2071 family)